jgi:hypothetical protein
MGLQCFTNTLVDSWAAACASPRLLWGSKKLVAAESWAGSVYMDDIELGWQDDEGSGRQHQQQ